MTTYREPQPVSTGEALALIAQDDVERLRTLAIDLGFHHADWHFIQDISVRSAEHPDVWVRRNALLGLEYAARFHGRVVKNIVKPVLLRALRDPNPLVSSNAKDVIEAINHLMKWRIGEAQRRMNSRSPHPVIVPTWSWRLRHGLSTRAGERRLAGGAARRSVVAIAGRSCFRIRLGVRAGGWG